MFHGTSEDRAERQKLVNSRGTPPLSATRGPFFPKESKNVLRPIETVYNGYRFRSRLEARWAVFFDALDLLYTYEREGYDLDGTWYLPDFWLPQRECFIEIKGETPTQEEHEKALKLAQHSGHRVFLFEGEITIPSRENYTPFVTAYYPYDDALWAWGPSYMWAECPHCRSIDLVQVSVNSCRVCVPTTQQYMTI